MSYDVVLTGHLVHAPDCPMVALARARGEPLMSMYGCERALPPLPPDIERHHCFQEDR